MYLTLTLNPSIDHYMRLPSGKLLKTGTKEAPSVNRASSESFEAGGKGINVAKILSRLQADVAATGFTAGFTGSEIARNIEAEGIESSFIEVPGCTRINLKITDGSGIETEINGPGPVIGPGDIKRLIEVLKNDSYDTLFISGSMPGGLPSDTYANIIKAVKETRPALRVITDFEGEALLRTLPFKPFLIKPNAAELSALTGHKISTASSLTDIKKAASMLIEDGACNVLISLGANGACLLTSEGNFYSVHGIKGDVISTIGAGDTMIASFIFMLDRSGDHQTALRFSNECASLSAFTKGLPSAKALGNILSNY